MALDKITYDMVDNLTYGEKIKIDENHTLYHYFDEDVIVVFCGDTEVYQIQFGKDKELILWEI